MKKDVAILGATLTVVSLYQSWSWVFSKSGCLRKFGQRPRYKPLIPSNLIIILNACKAPLYLMDPPFIPVTCIFLRKTSKGYVRVCEMVPASAPQANFRVTLFFPGGVITPRKNSYAAKLIPTYGATPIAVVTSPRYNPRMPPSSRRILSVIPTIVRSTLV